MLSDIFLKDENKQSEARLDVWLLKLEEFQLKVKRWG
jgi:hypothetical protein